MGEARSDLSPWIRGFLLSLLSLVLLNALLLSGDITVERVLSVPWIRVATDFLGLKEIHRTAWILVIAIFGFALSLRVLWSALLGKKLGWIAVSQLFEEGRARNALAVKIETPPEGWHKETRASGESQWAVPRSRVHRVFRGMAALAFAILVIAGAISELYGFTGVFAADEESRISIIEARHGRPPRGWSRWRANGLEVPDVFVAPSFFQLGRIDVEPGQESGSFKSIRSLFRIGTSNDVKEHSLVPGRPLRVGRWFFFQGGLKVVGPMSVKLIARDRTAQHELVLAKTPVHGTIELDGATVKILTAEKGVDEMGASVELKYVEGNREPGERFWIFEKRPEYDSTRRLGSRYVFSVDTVDSIYRGEIVVMRDIAAWVLLCAMVVFFIGMIGVLFSSSALYRVVETPEGLILVATGAPLSFLREYLEEEGEGEVQSASV